MRFFSKKKGPNLIYRVQSLFIAFTFIVSSIIQPSTIHAQVVPQTILNLPVPGTMIQPTTGFTPAAIKGITIHPNNPLRFDFIIDTGNTNFDINGEEFKKESTKLIKYFLASLTTPEEELWVNLSPYEKDRIIPKGFGQTEMGRDLLAQDYMLKQLTASLMYPEKELGKAFWERVYSKAQKLYGTTEIPINTFNKVWVMPKTATVYENKDTAYVVESRLKVMLEEDYLALDKNSNNEKFGTDALGQNDVKQLNNISSSVVRNIILPAIEKEINEGENFAQLRQIYQALILATWFKMNLKESLLGKIYVDQNKILGVDVKDRNVKDKIYQQYLEAFKKGVYDYIREDLDPGTQQIIPRKYFSGGMVGRFNVGNIKIVQNVSEDVINEMKNGSSPVVSVEARVDAQMVGSHELLKFKPNFQVKSLQNKEKLIKIVDKLREKNPERFNDFVQFIYEETGVSVGGVEKAVETVSNWFDTTSYANFMGVSYTNRTKALNIHKFIKHYQIRVFKLQMPREGGFTLVSPKSVKALEVKVRAFLDEVEDWHRKETGEVVRIRNLKEFREWIYFKNLDTVFPFFQFKGEKNYALIKKYMPKLKFLVPHTNVVSPSEVERLKQMVVDWLVDQNNWGMLKKYGIVSDGINRENFDYKQAKESILHIKENWLSLQDLSKASGRQPHKLREKLDILKVDYIHLDIFSAEDSTNNYVYVNPIDSEKLKQDGFVLTVDDNGQSVTLGLPNRDLKSRDVDWRRVEEITGMSSIRLMEDPYYELVQEDIVGDKLYKKLGREEPILTTKETHELIQEYRKNNNGAALDTLLKWNRHLIKIIIKRVLDSYDLPMENWTEYEGIGTAGLARAIEDFDLHHPDAKRLSTYGAYWIRGLLQKELKREQRNFSLRMDSLDTYQRVGRNDEGLHEKVSQSFFENDLDGSQAYEELDFFHEIFSQLYDKMKNKNKERNFKVMQMRRGYSFQDNQFHDEMTLEETAFDVGLTPERVRMIENDHNPILGQIIMEVRGDDFNLATSSPIEIRINAKIINGKVSDDGEVVEPPKKGNGISSDIFELYPEFIVSGIKLNNVGGFHFAGMSWWKGMRAYKNAEGVTAHFKEGSLAEAYDENGVLIFKKDAIHRNTIHIGAKISNGKIVDEGKIIEPPITKAGNISPDIFDQYAEFTVSHMEFDNKGGAQFGGKVLWLSLKGYEYAKGTKIHFQDGDWVAAYDLDGKPIKDKREQYQNSIYINSKVINGKLEGGEFLKAFPNGVPKDILTQYKEFYVTNRNLTSDGRIKIFNRIWSTSLSEYAEGVTLHFKDEELIDAYDSEGVPLYENNNMFNQETSTLEHLFNSPKAQSDIERLLENFGIQDTFDILLEWHGFTPNSLSITMKKYLRRLGGTSRGRKILKQNNKGGFSFVNMRSLDNDGDISRLDIQRLTDKIITKVYHDIALTKNSNFLEQLWKQSQDVRNSEVLREVYRRVHVFYQDGVQTQIKGINFKKITLKLYQKIGIKFLVETLQEKGGALLADDPGLGKTIQSIGAALNINDGDGAEKILIIAPKRSVNSVWKKTIQEYVRGQPKVEIVNGKTLHSVKKQQQMKDARFVIVNYEAIRGEDNYLRNELKNLGFDFIILDEAHRIRGESYQTEAVNDISSGKSVQYKLAVTATPFVSRNIGKIFNILNWLFPNEYINRQTFNKQYRGSTEKIKQLGVDIKTFFLKRFKKDVTNLPSKRYINVPIVLNKEERRVYDAIEKEFVKWLSQFSFENLPSKKDFFNQFHKARQAAVDINLVEDKIIFSSDRGKEVYPYYSNEIFLDQQKYDVIKNSRGRWIKLKREGREYRVERGEGYQFVNIEGVFYQFKEERNNFLSSKYEAMDKIIEEKITIEEKIVIFTNYRGIVHTLAQRYKNYGVNYVLGDMSSRMADKEIEAFQNNDEQRIFISTYPSGGESISLTAGNNIIEVDKPIMSKDRTQSNDRPDRWGQTRPVNIYRLTARDTIDEDMEQNLAQGDLIFQLAFGGGISEDMLKNDFIKETLKKMKYSKETIKKFLEYKKDILSKQKEPLTTEMSSIDGKMNIKWDTKKLWLNLHLKDGSIHYVKSFSELLQVSDQLTENAKKILKKFIQQRIAFEAKEKIDIKKTLFWAITQEVMPELADVDYDGQIERNMLLSMHIMNLLLTRPSLTIEEIEEHIDDKNSISNALYFMDQNNIFNLFSLLGVLNKSYYYKGNLLSYEQSMNFSFTQGSISYIDETIVQSIAPNLRLKEVEFNREKPFESTARMFRGISREEEFRLSREASKGNEAAKKVLVSANLNLIVRLAKSIVSGAKKNRRGYLSAALRHIDMSDLYSDLYAVGQNELMERLNDYYYEYEDMSFEKYATSFLVKAINKEFYSRIQYQTHEMGILDDSAFDENKGETIQNRFLTSEWQGDLDDDEKIDSEQEEDGAEAILANLWEYGFREKEIEIVRLNFIEGMSINDILKTNPRLTPRQINDILEEAKERLQTVLSSSPLKEVGGIDFNPNNLNLKTQGQGINYNAPINPQLLESLTSSPIEGFSPIILRIIPIINLPMLLGLRNGTSSCPNDDNNCQNQITSAIKEEKIIL